MEKSNNPLAAKVGKFLAFLTVAVLLVSCFESCSVSYKRQKSSGIEKVQF